MPILLYLLPRLKYKFGCKNKEIKLSRETGSTTTESSQEGWGPWMKQSFLYVVKSVNGTQAAEITAKATVEAAQISANSRVQIAKEEGQTKLEIAKLNRQTKLDEIAERKEIQARQTNDKYMGESRSNRDSSIAFGGLIALLSLYVASNVDSKKNVNPSSGQIIALVLILLSAIIIYKGFRDHSRNIHASINRNGFLKPPQSSKDSNSGDSVGANPGKKLG